MKSRKAFAKKRSLGEEMSDNQIRKAQRRSTSRKREGYDSRTYKTNPIAYNSNTYRQYEAAMSASINSHEFDSSQAQHTNKVKKPLIPPSNPERAKVFHVQRFEQ